MRRCIETFSDVPCQWFFPFENIVDPRCYPDLSLETVLKSCDSFSPSFNEHVIISITLNSFSFLDTRNNLWKLLQSRNENGNTARSVWTAFIRAEYEKIDLVFACRDAVDAMMFRMEWSNE